MLQLVPGLLVLDNLVYVRIISSFRPSLIIDLLACSRIDKGNGPPHDLLVRGACGGIHPDR